MLAESNGRLAQSNIYALEEIRSLSLPLSRPLYRNYPAMKLGQARQIEFFSQRLQAVAARILEEHAADAATSDDTGWWAITAPPYHELPAAANLLARKVQQLLAQRGYRVALHEMRLSAQQVAVRNQGELREVLEYSRSSQEQRIKQREKLRQLENSAELAARLEGRPVLVINDIHVTGAQQRSMSKTLAEFRVRACHWLYIFNVDRSIAETNPEVENTINTSQLSDIDSYADLLCSRQTAHTAICLSRLFCYDMDSFRYLVSLMPLEVRTHLHRIAKSEGRYCSQSFEAKMGLLMSQ